MVLVDIYGAPGSGKSVAAAWIFAQLKMRDVKCEHVTEFAKDMVWDTNMKALDNQAYVFGSQYYRLSRLENEVEVAVVDSPLLLSCLYCRDVRLGNSFKETVASVARSYDCLSYFIEPFKSKYEDVGRVHSQAESMLISKKIEDLLQSYNISVKRLEHDELSYMGVVNDVMKKLGERDGKA